MALPLYSMARDVERATRKNQRPIRLGAVASALLEVPGLLVLIAWRKNGKARRFRTRWAVLGFGLAALALSIVF